jgi:hypothetical protein
MYCPAHMGMQQLIVHTCLRVNSRSADTRQKIKIKTKTATLQIEMGAAAEAAATR